MNSRRTFLKTSGGAIAGGAGAYLTLGAGACSTSPITILTGLVAVLSETLTGLVDGGIIPAGDLAYITAASKFATDIATELASNDTALEKISKSFGFYATDLGRLPIPGAVGTFVQVAILAVNAIMAFLNAQPTAAAESARAVPVAPVAFTISATPSRYDKAVLDQVIANQKALKVKL